MKIWDHEIHKICKEQDPEKYIALTNVSLGYAKLCCYAVKELNKKEIVTSYENICVALWLMFPKADNFHLTDFDDMPDTDFMEKLIKLRSRPSEQGYLTGGTIGQDKKLKTPWQLTKKGQVYAKEAASILSGEIQAPDSIEKEQKAPENFENTFEKIWKSDLYIQFSNGDAPDKIDEFMACATLDMFYSQRRFKEDFNKKIDLLGQKLNSFEKDISDKRIDSTRKFLAWMKKAKK